MKKSGIMWTVVVVGLGVMAGSASAQWVAYHDMGATTGDESTGNITTHQSGSDGVSANTLDEAAKNLIKYADGTDTGVDFSIAGANAMDSRTTVTGPPEAGTPAAALFNIGGLNLNNGLIYEGGTTGEGATTFTLSGLDPAKLYDVALYGHRISVSSDGVERFTLGGADSAVNSSSTGILAHISRIWRPDPTLRLET